MLRNLKMHWRRFRDIEVLTVRGVKVCTKVPRQVRSLLFKEIYEAHECDLVEGVVCPGDRVLEIGTGIGLVSLVATRLCGEGNVLSCEANSDLESIIRENYRLNGWTPDLTMHAVTSDGRDLSFFRNSNVFSSSTIDRGLECDEITVESLAINDLIDKHRPSVVIMDAEGSEVEILPVADLSRVRTIIVEMHPHIVGEDKITRIVGDVEMKGFRLVDTHHRTYLLRNTKH